MWLMCSSYQAPNTPAPQLLLATYKKMRSRMAKSMSRVMDTFRSLDRDSSGTLNIREFHEAMRQLNVSCTHSDARAIFDLYVLLLLQSMASARLGSKDWYGSLHSLLLPQRYRSNPNTTSFDENGDGDISWKEFYRGLRQEIDFSEVIAAEKVRKKKNVGASP